MKLSLVCLFISGVFLHSSNALPQNTGTNRPIPGGLTAAEVKDPKVQQYALASLSTFQGTSGFSGKLDLVQVVEAHTQVVSGVIYHLTLKIADPSGASKTCKVKVWVEPWISEKPKEIYDASCEDKPSSRK